MSTGRMFEKDADAQMSLDELERRHDLTKLIRAESEQKGVEPQLTSSYSVSTSVTEPEEQHRFASFLDPDQQWVVVNLAHRGQRPKKERPAIRILGFFAQREEAIDYIQQATSFLSGCNLWLFPVSKYITICQTMERQQHATYGPTKAELLLNKYMEDKKRRDAEFAANRTNKQQGKQGLSFDRLRKENRLKRESKRTSTRRSALKRKAELQKTQVLPTNTPQDQMERGVREVPGHLLRRKQDFVVVSILKDVSKHVLSQEQDPEPVLIFWRAFPSYAIAKAWTKTMGARHVTNVSLDIVDAYEWLFPEDVDMEHVDEGYRNSEQDKVMRQRKIEKDKVLDFESWHKAEGKTMPVTEVIVPDKELLLPETERSIPVITPLQPAFEVQVDAKSHTDWERVEVQLDHYTNPLHPEPPATADQPMNLE